jgi:hypothetical protein
LTLLTAFGPPALTFCGIHRFFPIRAAPIGAPDAADALRQGLIGLSLERRKIVETASPFTGH